MRHGGEVCYLQLLCFRKEVQLNIHVTEVVAVADQSSAYPIIAGKTVTSVSDMQLIKSSIS